ncbi:SDR family NAD(P)-dependent oxidoreductase [Nonomuraea typhae]|uniref:SDR family NAD(P)-dependent oxidoreductase n=1 Tax=Nonomuraea typhae TaxID=2603600 RepID=UPI001CA481C1|nr:SDR family NAD(P)-dependent oxidoreductase [Nonomuraea typhae]
MNAIPDEEIAAFHQLVGRLRALPPDDPQRLRAEQVAASFVHDGKRRRRQDRRSRAAEADAALVAATATGRAERREGAPLATRHGQAGVLNRRHTCYVCGLGYRELDAFYHRLCPACASENKARRTAGADLTGRRVLLTGGRVKIGFQLALMMLRDGAHVTVTSRFPGDAVRRFRREPGSDAWFDRLSVIGADLRDPRQVLGLCAGVSRLDVLVNNAAQTLRQPAAAYAALAEGERRALPPGSRVSYAPGFDPAAAISPAAPLDPAHAAGPAVPLDQAHAISLAAPLDQAHAAGPAVPLDPADARSPAASPGPAFTAGPAASPGPAYMAGPAAGDGGAAGGLVPVAGAVDEAGLLPDPSATNSWTARLGGLDPAEVLEAQLVNAIAPALLCDRLLPVLLASPYPSRYIVNVTGAEGRFAAEGRPGAHPHTNMAKAALNMLTRTGGADLAVKGVYMCAVDTGWITDQSPLPKKVSMAARGFRPPLDVVDGAARVYDPIVRGEAGDPVAGVLLRNYREAAW